MSKENIKIIKEEAPKPGSLGFAELYALSVGQVIGAGVITLIVPAIKMTGYSAWLAYFVAIIMGFLMIAPWVLTTSVLRLGGGNYSLLADLASPEFAGIFSYTFLLNSIILALFGRSAAAYIGDTIPPLSTDIGQIVVGASVLTIFYIINIKGVNIMAKAQKLMTWILIASLFIFTIVGFFNIKLPVFDFNNPNFLTEGWGLSFTEGQITGGFLGAVLLFVYSCNGYYLTASYGRDAKNARKDIPNAMLMTVPTLILLYVGVAIVASGVMSLAEYGDSTTLVFTAQKIFPPLGSYLFIIGGPIMALLSTINSSFASNAIQIGQSCKDGWFPKSFGEKNKNGSYYKILTFMYIVSLIPIILNLSIVLITNMVQIVIATTAFLNIPAFLNLPNKYPKAWRERRIRIPTFLYKLVIYLSLILYIITFLKSLLSMNIGLAAGSLVLLCIIVILAVYKTKNSKITLHTSVWTD